MTDLIDTFEQIEHVEFAARLQGADDVPMFLDFVHSHAAVQGLFAARDPEAIVQRIHRLMTKRIDPNYMHPEDPALAAYFDTLYRMQNREALQRAWKLCAKHAKLYWTHQVAQSINLREEVVVQITEGDGGVTRAPEPEIDPVEDATDLAPEPDPEPSPINPNVPTTAGTGPTAQDMDVPPPAPAVFPAPPAAIDKAEFARTFYAVYTAATKKVAEARGQQTRPTPAWDDLASDHPVRAILQTTSDDMLARLHAVAYVPFPPEDINQRRAVAEAIQQGKLAARVVLTPEE